MLISATSLSPSRLSITFGSGTRKCQKCLPKIGWASSSRLLSSTCMSDTDQFRLVDASKQWLTGRLESEVVGDWFCLLDTADCVVFFSILVVVGFSEWVVLEGHFHNVSNFIFC